MTITMILTEMTYDNENYLVLIKMIENVMMGSIWLLFLPRNSFKDWLLRKIRVRPSAEGLWRILLRLTQSFKEEKNEHVQNHAEHTVTTYIYIYVYIYMFIYIYILQTDLCRKNSVTSHHRLVSSLQASKNSRHPEQSQHANPAKEIGHSKGLEQSFYLVGK